MRFLNRKARTAKPAGKEEAPTVVYREIEITVQREWTSVTVRNPVAEGMQPTRRRRARSGSAGTRAPSSYGA